jgi:uncharacterized phage protein gp47/JayE
METNLILFQNTFKGIYGEDFKIKSEGVIDNLAVATSGIKMDFESQLLFLKKQLNPFTATGIYQDALYKLVRLYRRQATYTFVQRTIEGDAGAIITAGSLMFENASTKDQFLLDSDVTLGDDGKAVGTFKSQLIGEIELPTEANINIITPLPTVEGIYYSDGNTENVGLSYENDEEFRKRFISHQNVTSRMYKALLDIVDNAGDILILQNRAKEVYADFGLHTMQITIHTAHSDEEIAQIIFDNLLDGVDLDGSNIVIMKDDSNQPVEIRFNRSSVVDVYIKTTVKKFEKSSEAEAIAETKTAIQEYTKNTTFPMGDEIVGNRFNSLIDAAPSIDYPLETLVSRDGSEWVRVLPLGAKEVPAFNMANVTIEVV